MFDMGRIIVADDNWLSLEFMKAQIKNSGFENFTEFCVNGKQVIDLVKEIVNEQLQTASSFPIRPVHALVLDFQMP